MAQTSRLVLEIDSRDAEQKAADVRKALGALEDAGIRIKPAMDKAGAGLDGLSSSSDKATKSVQDQRDEIEALLGRIDPLSKKLGELDRQEQELVKHRKAGTIDTETYAVYQQKITATRAELGRFNESLNKTGVSAKQNAAALRMLPAQFSDIAVSLQGGQAPLTVLLQQGSQIKDSFGGVGSASKALGGYILGLVSPFSAAAAAAGVLGLAYFQGSKEADAFRLSLVSTGNASGTTTIALAEMASRVGDAVGTTGQAAAALAQLAASGKIASSSFEEIAIATIAWEKASGQAVATTISEFNKLADDPVKAIAELNEKYNFLTASVYEQVRAAQEQGDKQAAAAIAEEAYARALTARAGTIKQNLGTLERAWDDLAGAAKSGWDAILDIGRESSKGPDLTAIQQKINYLKSTLDTGFEDGNARQRIATLQAELDGYAKKAKAEQDAASAAARAAQVQRDGQVAYEAFQKSIEQNFTKRQKMNKAIEDEEKRINAARTAGYTISEDQASASLKAIRENSIYKESAPKKEKAYTEDAGMKYLDAARQTQAVLIQQNTALNAQGVTTQILGTQAQALVRWELQLASIKSKQTLTSDQKSLLASQELITAQLKKNVALEREAEISRDIQQAQKDQVQLLTLTGQLLEANKLKSSLDDAAQMAEYERQGNTEAMKRLETMIKIRDINLQSAQKPGTVEGVTQAPDATGLDGSVGGPMSEITRLNEEAAKVEAWRSMELEKQAAYLELRAINEETYAERVANINAQGQAQRAKIEQAKNQAILVSSADFFGSMASLSQSGHKTLGAIGKAAAIAQATISGYTAIQNALAVPPFPVGIALAVAAGVSTAANIAAIAGVGFSAGGYTGAGGVNQPAGTVHKGEVVWSQADISRFGGVAAVEALRNGNVSPVRGGSSGTSNSAGASTSSPSMNVEINNYSSARVSTQTDEAGRLRVIIQEVEAHLVQGVAQGNGDFNNVLEHSYGLNRQGY